MSKLLKRVSLAVLSLLFVFALSLTLVQISPAKAAETGGYENLIANGDFETQADSWGLNCWVPVSFVHDDERDSQVGKITECVNGASSWINARVWNAGFLVGGIYQFHAYVKWEGTTEANSTTQFCCRFLANDGNCIVENNIGGVGGDGGWLPNGVWKELGFWISFADNDEGTITVKAGVELGVATTELKSKPDVDLSYFDIGFGTNSWNETCTALYFDDISFVKIGNVNESLFDNTDFEQEFEVNKWGINSGGEYYLDPATESHVAKMGQTGGWINNRLYGETFVADHTYRINVDLKVENPGNVMDGTGFLLAFQHTATGDNQQLAYGGVGANPGVASNVYRSYNYYIKPVTQGDKIILYGGATRSALQPLVNEHYALQHSPNNYVECTDAFPFIDIAIGVGDIGTATAWYVDNFYVTDLDAKEPEIPTYTATATVQYENGEAAEGFTYTVGGGYVSHSVSGNVITVEGCTDDVSVTVSQPGYITATASMNSEDAAKTIVLKQRAITPDETDSTGNLFGPYGFESEATMSAMEGSKAFSGWNMFVNGAPGQVGLQVVDEESYLGNNSLKVTSTGDRFVTRILADYQSIQQIEMNVNYHISLYAKAANAETIELARSVVVGPFVEGSDNYEKGWGPDGIYAHQFNYGENVTITNSAWTRIDLDFSFSLEGNLYKITLNDRQLDSGDTYSVNLTHAGDFDVSLAAVSDGEQLQYYIDNIAIFKTYDGEITILDESRRPVAEGVNFTITDLYGAPVAAEPVYNDGKYTLSGIYGVVNVKAEVNGKTYEGALSASYPTVLLADEYTAKIKVMNYDGTAVETGEVIDVYAMDGAARIPGDYSEEFSAYVFEGAMGDLEVSVLVKGAQQHKKVILTAADPEGVYYVEYVPDDTKAGGLSGNNAVHGNAEDLGALIRDNSDGYTYPGITTGDDRYKWFSFGPLLSLSDEAAAGEHSLRIDNSAAALAAASPEYAAYLDEKGLEANPNMEFGNRVGFRGGNTYDVDDGTVYKFTAYVKAPSEQASGTTFELIYLIVVNLNNTGAFNLWCPITFTADTNHWTKIEMIFSFSVSEDDDANESGKYDFERWKETFKYKLVVDGKEQCDYTGVYGYNVYADGQPLSAYYGFDPDGGENLVRVIGEQANVQDDSSKDGGASFGSIAYVEPSFQIKDELGKALLVDGATMTTEYDANLTVLNRDLTPNRSFKYFRLVDKYTGAIEYLEASELFNEEEGKYTITNLFHSYDVTVVDEDKQPLEGLETVTIASSGHEVIIEYSYDVEITLVDQYGNRVNDLIMRITAADGTIINVRSDGNGVYRYAGLTGIRPIGFRKDGGRDYDYPVGLTVSSSDCVKTVTVTVREESSSGSGDDSSEEKVNCKSCSGAAGTGMLVGIVALAASCVIRRKRS